MLLVAQQVAECLQGGRWRESEQIFARLGAGYAHALLREAVGGACHSPLGFAVLLSCLYSADMRQRPKCREHFGVWGSALAAKVAQDVVEEN